MNQEAHKRERVVAAKCCQLGRLAGYGASEIKHQQEPVGNAAKLREALIKAITMLAVCEWPDGTNMEGVEELRRDIDAALDAPPRNCDRFGTDNVEASLAYEEFCDRAEVEESVNGAIAWLLTLVAEKEGGAK